MTPDRRIEGDWYNGVVPSNVHIHESACIETTFSFLLFRSTREIGVTLGEGSSLYLGNMLDVGPLGRVDIGDYVLLNGARIICDTQIEIGSYSLIAWGVVLMDTYRLSAQPAARRRELEAAAGRSMRYLEGDGLSRPIRIGSNVWIGFDSCVLPGVTIGKGSIVGARSVVTQDVEPYTVVGGNPPRLIRRLSPGTGAGSSTDVRCET